MVTGNFANFSLEEIDKTISHKKQVIVFHNRRGYATVVECAACGHVSYCSNCDVVMTYHKASNELKCHYCGHSAAKPKICPKCYSENLTTRGLGVEQLYEEVKVRFPEAEVERMDVDSMRRKFAYERLFEKIDSGETDIIVGTQMVAKGLDFGNVQTVVVPRTDQLLYVQDYRAEERAYQLLVQLAGRAGRQDSPGVMYLQTMNPQHHIFSLLQSDEDLKIYDYLLQERERYLYPPFCKLIAVELKHRREEKAERASQYLSSLLLLSLPAELILGPQKAAIPKINLLYQYQLLLKLPLDYHYKEYKQALKNALADFRKIPAYRSIKLTIAVDF